MNALGEDYARIRFGETESVPLGPGIWFLVVTVKGSTLHFLEFRCTRQGIADFERFLSTNPAEVEVRIFGVWHGAYRTDLFLMNPGVLLGRLRTELNRVAAKKKKG